MSTLQVSTAQITTLSDGTNTTSCTNAIQGSAKAWVNFNGTTSPGTIRASYNVSSVTKNTTGDYTVNFTNSLVDSNYSVNLSIGTTSQRCLGITSQSTTQLRVFNNYSMNASLVDDSIYCVSVFR